MPVSRIHPEHLSPNLCGWCLGTGMSSHLPGRFEYAASDENHMCGRRSVSSESKMGVLGLVSVPHWHCELE